MKLQEFLTLSHEEIIENRDLISLLMAYEDENRIETISSIIVLIKTTDPVILIKLTYSNPVINALCHHPDLIEHWQKIWRLCGYSNKIPDGFKPLPILHCFELIKGIYLYWQYKIEKDRHSPHKDEYLLASVKMKCFIAMNVSCNKKLQLLRSNFSEEIIHDLIQISQDAAKYYRTPGYLLLTNTLVSIASIIKSKSSHLMFHAARVNKLYEKALDALYKAKKLKKDSKNQIHVAYNGKTLSEVYANTYLQDFSQAKKRIKSMSNLIKENIYQASETGKNNSKSVKFTNTKLSS